MVCEMGAVAWPSGRGGFERALSHHVHVRNARCDSRLRRREDFFQNQLQENHACRESQGARSKRAERVFVPCDQVAPEAQARRPLRESAASIAAQSSDVAEATSQQGCKRLVRFHPIAISQVSWREQWLGKDLPE